MAAAEASRELALRSDEVPGTWYAVTITWVGRIIVTILVLLFTWFGASAAAGRPQHQPGEPVEIKRCRQTQLTSGQWHRRHRLHTQQCAVVCSLAFTLCPRHHMDELQQPSLEEAKLGGEQPCLEGAKPG